MRVEILNSGGSIATGSYGRITLQTMSKEDVLSEQEDAFITKAFYRKVEGMNIAWANNRHETKGIPTKQSEMLLIARLETKQVLDPSKNYVTEVLPTINLSSGTGFERKSENEKPRVLLNTNKKYTGMLEVGAANVAPISTTFELFVQENKLYMQLSN